MIESGSPQEAVWQAWYGTDEPWGGCADRERIDRVLDIAAPPIAASDRTVNAAEDPGNLTPPHNFPSATIGRRP